MLFCAFFYSFMNIFKYLFLSRSCGLWGSMTDDLIIVLQINLSVFVQEMIFGCFLVKSF